MTRERNRDIDGQGLCRCLGGWQRPRNIDVSSPRRILPLRPIERANQARAQTPNPDEVGRAVETYDPKSIPKGTIVPDAELDCDFIRGGTLCGVLVGGRLVAFISPHEAKANLAGWRDVPSPNQQKAGSGRKP